jgi:hypothetical protein
LGREDKKFLFGTKIAFKQFLKISKIFYRERESAKRISASPRGARAGIKSQRQDFL